MRTSFVLAVLTGTRLRQLMHENKHYSWDGFETPVAEIIATYTAERTMPGCKKMTFDD